MFSNFSNFLSSSLRILNIANRALPLVRDISPTISSIRKKISNANLPKLSAPAQPTIQNNINKNIVPRKNNSLTFFR